jgi:hypothetical protein
MGRPRDQAPKGRVTVREAAQILGVSESAVGGRIERGTLSAKEVPLQSGERRYYLPRDVIEEEGKCRKSRRQTRPWRFT